MRVPLDQPLPADVLRRSSVGLGSYRHYPVFSWPWLRKRTAIHAALAGSFAALVSLTLWLAEHRTGPALTVFFHFVAGALLISTTGPALATFVRHRAFEPIRERRLIIASLIIGAIASLGFDVWASEGMESSLPPSPVTPGEPPPFALALNLAFVAVIYWLFGGGLALSRYLTEANQLTQWRHELELHELRARHVALDAKLGLLQAQVEPHFLFNTLASLRSLVATDPSLAQTTIDALADYLRATIPRLRGDATNADSTLGQQLDLCESYLRVMAVRLGGRLSTKLDVDARLRAARFPPLVLITLVENALTHGIEPNLSGGTVRLVATTTNDRLRVSVIDDGAGLQFGVGSGVGLSNVRALLTARYGTGGTLSLSGAPNRGADASIEIPLEWSAP